VLVEGIRSRIFDASQNAKQFANLAEIVFCALTRHCRVLHLSEVAQLGAPVRAHAQRYRLVHVKAPMVGRLHCLSPQLQRSRSGSNAAATEILPGSVLRCEFHRFVEFCSSLSAAWIDYPALQLGCGPRAAPFDSPVGSADSPRGIWWMEVQAVPASETFERGAIDLHAATVADLLASRKRIDASIHETRFSPSMARVCRLPASGGSRHDRSRERGSNRKHETRFAS